MDTAFLLSGDEDLREAVGRAQASGVRVTLLGIPGTRQATTLIAEADRHVVLPEELWRKHVSLNRNGGTKSSSDDGALVKIVRSVLDGWLGVAQQPEISQALARKPKVPAELDKQLLRKAVAILGVPDIPDEMRENIRVEFWNQLSNRDG